MPGAQELLALLVIWESLQRPVESDDDFLKSIRVVWEDEDDEAPE
jgi:hypothetical protein